MIEYPISANYCKNWTIKEAIRELIANARDEGEFITTWEDGIGCIQDFGKGIPKQFFVLGEGEDKTNTQIGQFREGLKIAGLVFAREGRKIQGRTLKYSFKFTMGQSQAFECPVVMLEINEIPMPVIGTIITFQCTQEELETAKAMFLDIETAQIEGLLKGENIKGHLYINGVFAQTVKTMFGYNILDKSAANRDRSILDSNAVNKAIIRIWHNNVDGDTIKALLLSKEQFSEHSLDITPQDSLPANAIWKETVTTIYGDRCCLSDDKAHIARDRGWTIITPQTWSLAWNLNYHISIPYATEMLSRKENLDYRNILMELDSKSLIIVLQAKQITENVLETKLNVEVVATLSFGKDNVLSEYDPKDKIIRLARKTIERGFDFVVGVLMHEGLHQTSGADDSSAAFEWVLTQALGKAVVQASSVYFRHN